MKDKTELIVLVVVLVLIYTRPSALVRFSSSLVGKVIFLAAVIISSLISPLSGLLIATLMVMFMEQNYEGFKEGNTGTLPASVDTKVIGDYASGATILAVENDSANDIANLGNGNYELAGVTDIIEKHTIVNDVSPTVTIKLIDTDTIPDGTITTTTTFTIISKTADTSAKCEETATTSVAVDKAACDAVTGTGLDDATTCDGVMTNADTSIKACTYTPVAVSSVTDLATGTYNNDNIPSGAIKYINVSELSYSGTNTISNLTGDIYLKIQGADTEYQIDSVFQSSALTLSSGLIGKISDTTSITIQEHTHVHQHTTESFEGMDGKEADAGEEAVPGEDSDTGEEADADKDDEEKEEKMNPGLSKLIKDATDKINDIKTEGFFSGNDKKSEVVGAFVGETYETEITPITAVCTTPRCERIHREEQLIRPVNSNELL